MLELLKCIILFKFELNFFTLHFQTNRNYKKVTERNYLKFYFFMYVLLLINDTGFFQLTLQKKII